MAPTKGSIDLLEVATRLTQTLVPPEAILSQLILEDE